MSDEYTIDGLPLGVDEYDSTHTWMGDAATEVLIVNLIAALERIDKLEAQLAALEAQRGSGSDE